MRLPYLLPLLISQNKVVFQNPEPFPVLAVNFPDKRLGAVRFGDFEVFAPDDVLGQAGLGAKDRVERQARTLFVVQGGVELFVVGVGDEEVLSRISAGSYKICSVRQCSPHAQACMPAGSTGPTQRPPARRTAPGSRPASRR